jgi:hypothetical protein
MSKEFSEYEGSLPESEDAFHVAVEGTLRLINFKVGHSELREQHKTIITNKLVPFLVAATKALGPGDYNLRCAGFGSASGTFDLNDELSKGRAEASAGFAISELAKKAGDNPHLAHCRLKPEEIPRGKIDASIDAVNRHLSIPAVDKYQAHYRAAQFFLSAGKSYPPGSEIFQIREIYLFKFSSKSEPLPKALEWLKKLWDSKGVIRFLFKGLDVLLKDIEAALGPEGKLAMIMVTWMVPDDLDACYEVKNIENVHALYRFFGSGHNINFDILDALKAIDFFEITSKIIAILKVVKTVIGLPGKADKVVQFIEKFQKDFHKKAVDLAREKVGSRFAEFVDVYLTMSENGVTAKAMLAPASDFVPFKFHDLSAEHQVSQLAGPARRNVFALAFNQVVDIEFGGPVANNWIDYQAEAKIKSFVTDALAIGTSDLGAFELLRGDYGFDVVVGPTNVIKG